MKFEVGKSYEHRSGIRMRILAKAYSYLHGHILIAERSDLTELMHLDLYEHDGHHWFEIPDTGHEIMGVLPPPKKRITLKLSDEVRVSDSVTINPKRSPPMEKGHTFQLFNHGYVKLVDYMGSDEAIVEAARMSTGKGFVSWDPYPGRPEDGDQGFLEFLLKNNHTSPFEMCELCIEVQAPIFVFREWHRHRTQSYNEFSARYSQMPDLHYLPEESRIVKQSKTNKQGSGTEEMTHEAKVQIICELERQQTEVYETYDAWVENGLAKEIARINTPVARYSKMRAKTDLLNWLKFLNLRMRPNAMLEIRQYANTVAKIIQDLFPRTFFLFEEHWLYSRSFSRMEVHALFELFKDAVTTETLMANAKRIGLSPKKAELLLKKLTTPGEVLL